MKLKYYKVKKFRSVYDTQNIETQNITALIGENESGKTNILLPLWKLNPATNSENAKLNLLNDYPRKEYHLIHSHDSELRNEIFVEGRFELNDEEIKSLLNDFSVKVREINLSRDYNNKLQIDLIDENANNVIENKIEEIQNKIKQLPENDFDYKGIETALSELISGNITKTTIDGLNIIKDEKKQQICDDIKIVYNIKKDITNLDASKIFELIPKFIYYSDYGNLDSEIYLPDVIKKMDNQNIKNRTLKTLFEFVKLSPDEIYKMGQSNVQNPSEDQKKEMQEKINKRQALLESASTNFSKSFNQWWGQGNYRFNFKIDGDYFRIKVSDSTRPENIELEHRSRGLQWFFSFYLVFLVESQKSHKNCILLLDEPGVTLHPNAQKDLYNFFENLSKDNQLIYTTHSPFMINPNQLDMVYAVYVDDNGLTCVTNDLRHTDNRRQANSIYPAFAALGLSVSDTLLQGCIPIIVEGISDQIYLSLIKNALISSSILKTNKEIVFIPSNGVKGIKSILSLLSCIESSQYPYVILDDDKAGQELKKSLEKELYAGMNDKIISLYNYKPNSEIEDILPVDEFIKTISSYLPKLENVDDDFEEEVDKNNLICKEIELYCTKYQIELKIGFKVELAKKFKSKILKKDKNIFDMMDENQKKFVKEVFDKFVK